MIDNNNIEELVKQKLQNFETEVSANVWDKIENNLDLIQPNIDPSTVADTAVHAAGTNISAWVAGIGAAVIGVVTVGVLYFNQPNENVVSEEKLADKVEQNEINNLSVINEEVKNAENTIEAKDVATENTIVNSESNAPVEVSSETAFTENEITDKNLNSSSTIESTNPDNELISDDSQSSLPVVNDIDNSAAANADELTNENQNNTIREVVIPESIIEDIKYIEVTPTLIEDLIVEQESINALPSSIGPIPNVFTPNGDGINDHFIFPTENIAEVRISIYNSKGSLVYELNGKDNWYWDGFMRNGEHAIAGSYYYAIYARGMDNKMHQNKGTLYLNR